MLRSGTPDDREAFKIARNQHVANIRSAKKVAWKSFVKNPDGYKKMWAKLTKGLINGRKEPGIPSVLHLPDGSYTDGIVETVELLLKELIPHSRDDPVPIIPPEDPHGKSTCRCLGFEPRP